jgi:hypothetical protein
MLAPNPAPSTGENLTRSIRAPKILPSRLRVRPVADEMLRKMAHRRQTKAGRALTPKSPGFESAAGTGARTGGLIFIWSNLRPNAERLRNRLRPQELRSRKQRRCGETAGRCRHSLDRHMTFVLAIISGIVGWRKAFFFTHNRIHRRSNLRYHRKYIKNLHSCAYLLTDNTGESRMNNAYLNVISLIERLHRQFLEVVKLELDGMGIRDINNVQAMVLFNIGDAEIRAAAAVASLAGGGGCFPGQTSSMTNRIALFRNSVASSARAASSVASVLGTGSSWLTQSLMIVSASIGSLPRVTQIRPSQNRRSISGRHTSHRAKWFCQFRPARARR